MRPKIVWLMLFLVCGFLFQGCGHLINLNQTKENSKVKSHPSKKTTSKEASKVKTPVKNLEGENRHKKSDLEKIREISTILQYFRFLNALPEEALEKEHARAQKEFSENQGTVNRLRLAMLLSITSPEHQAHEKSLALFNKYLNGTEGQDPLVKDFSFLFSSFVQRVINQEQQFKNQKKQIENQEQKYKKLSQKSENQESENRKLKKIIEELKSIEKNLMKRDETKTNE